jgi:hypothetical protein
MKNIHILPTDKPSRLLKNTQYNTFWLRTDYLDREVKRGVEKLQYQNIYITSDEEIKEGEWFLMISKTLWGENTICKLIQEGSSHCIIQHNNVKHRVEADLKWLIESNGTKAKKIILTKDHDLIREGVQDIDNKFLKWFVKNPSCEFVEVEKGYRGIDLFNYKIIIPKEEPKQYKVISVGDGLPKQETLEEAAENYGWGIKKNTFSDPVKANDLANSAMEDFIVDAKWQAERMCSEEESFENKSLKWWMSLSTEEQVEIGFKYDEPTFNLTLRAIMFEFEQFKKNKS